MSVRWNACVNRLDLGLYSHPKESLRTEQEPMLVPRESSPLPEEGPTRHAAQRGAGMLFVGCLTSQQHASVSQDGSAQIILRAATLR